MKWGGKSVIDQFLLMICAVPILFPIMVLLKKTIYNIEDCLMPIFHEHLNGAQRALYLRCLFKQQVKRYGQHWRKKTYKRANTFLKLDQLRI